MLSMFLTILSIAIGILGLLPLILSIRNYRISCTEKVDRLYLSRNNQDINVSVSYKGEPSSLPLAITSLVFKNDGNKDIDYHQRFIKPVEITSSLIDVLDVRSFQSNSDINVSTIIQNNEVLLSWDLLKKGESITLEIVGNVLDQNLIAQLEGQCFNVSIRAADIKGIRKSHNMGMRKRLALLFVAWLFISSFSPVIRDFMNSQLVGDLYYKGDVIKDAAICCNIFTGDYFVTSTTKRVEQRIPAEDVSTITVINSKLPSNNYRFVNLGFFF